MEGCRNTLYAARNRSGDQRHEVHHSTERLKDGGVWSGVYQYYIKSVQELSHTNKSKKIVTEYS